MKYKLLIEVIIVCVIVNVLAFSITWLAFH